MRGRRSCGGLRRTLIRFSLSRENIIPGHGDWGVSLTPFSPGNKSPHPTATASWLFGECVPPAAAAGEQVVLRLKRRGAHDHDQSEKGRRGPSCDAHKAQFEATRQSTRTNPLPGSTLFSHLAMANRPRGFTCTLTRNLEANRTAIPRIPICNAQLRRLASCRPSCLRRTDGHSHPAKWNQIRVRRRGTYLNHRQLFGGFACCRQG